LVKRLFLDVRFLSPSITTKVFKTISISLTLCRHIVKYGLIRFFISGVGIGIGIVLFRPVLIYV